MTENFKILILEDNPDDVKLLKRELYKADYNFISREVDSKSNYLKELKNFQPDLILSDYSMPQFTGLDALKIAKEKYPDTPFIIVTGSLSDELAVRCLREGAWDYVIKEHLPHIRMAIKNVLSLKAENDKEKILEQELIDSEEKFRTLFNSSKDAIMTLEPPDWLFSSGNPAILKMFGVKNLEEFLSLKPWDISPKTQPDGQLSIDKAKKMIKKALNEESSFFEWTHKKINGDNFPATVLLNKVKLKDKILLQATVRNISEQKKAEEKLKLLAVAIESALEAIVITNKLGKIEYANQSFEKLTGITKQNALDTKIFDIVNDKQRVKFQTDFKRISQAGQYYNNNIEIKKNNNRNFSAQMTLSPVKMENGEIINIVSVFRDITYEEELEEQLRQSQKMEAIGTLAGGIAHDFNNILQIIFGSLGVAKNHTGQNKELEMALEQATHASKRAKDLVSQILTFSRKIKKQKRILKISTIIKEELKLIRSSIPPNIKITKNINNTCCPIMADPSQIHQILLNLCTNAYHAIKDKEGSIDVILEQFNSDTDFNTLFTKLKAGSYAKLSIIDTGEGIDKKIKNRIFDPFFTTKDIDKGTGLGLSTVLGIIKDCSAGIKVNSEPGKGTEFIIFFPIIEFGETETTIDENKKISAKGNILFIDDEVKILQVIKLGLESFGYTVNTQSNGKEAISYFHNNYESFDLVITDQLMPGIKGIDIAAQIHEIRPDIPILLYSGFAGDYEMEYLEKIGIRQLVPKPIGINELAKIIQDVLN